MEPLRAPASAWLLVGRPRGRRPALEEAEDVACYTARRKRQRLSARNTACAAATATKDPGQGASTHHQTPGRTTCTSRRRAPAAATAPTRVYGHASPFVRDTESARKQVVVLRPGDTRRRLESHFTLGGSKPNRRGRLRQAGQCEANISRDRSARSSLKSWRYTRRDARRGYSADRLHYADCSNISSVGEGGERSFAQWCCRRQPDVASMVLEHETARCRRSTRATLRPPKYYLMKRYGKEASAYYDMHRPAGAQARQRRRDPGSMREERHFRRELEEFADAVRGDGEPEMAGRAPRLRLR